MALESDDGIRLLVVDDHAVVRSGLKAFLDGEPDLEVVGEAGGGTQALDLLARLDSEGRRPDVVVMDLQMAPLDGVESTRQIRARYDDVEVVALTSFAEKERVHAALEAGASGYLLKDSDADEVAAAVRAAHRGELQLDPAVARRLVSTLNETHPDPTGELTSREVEVLRLVGAGKANKEIAAELAISERTVRTHVSKILRKLRLTSRTQAALWAVRKGVVSGSRPGSEWTWIPALTNYNHIAEVQVAEGDFVREGEPFAQVSAVRDKPTLHFELWNAPLGSNGCWRRSAGSGAVYE